MLDNNWEYTCTMVYWWTLTNWWWLTYYVKVAKFAHVIKCHDLMRHPKMTMSCGHLLLWGMTHQRHSPPGLSHESMWVLMPQYKIMLWNYTNPFIVALHSHASHKKVMIQSNIPHDLLHLRNHTLHAPRSLIGVHLASTSLRCSWSCLTPKQKVSFPSILTIK